MKNIPTANIKLKEVEVKPLKVKRENEFYPRLNTKADLKKLIIWEMLFTIGGLPMHIMYYITSGGMSSTPLIIFFTIGCCAVLIAWLIDHHLKSNNTDNK
jgi:hypothetical protein